MKLPADVLDTRDRYVVAFPLWSMPPGPAAEERARTWTLGLCSQVAYEHPGEGYGSKRADQNRPISKDALARQKDDGTLLMWDMLSGAGDGSPTLVEHPDSQDVTGQVFVEVDAYDVIAGDEQVRPPDGGGGGPAPVPPYNENYAVQFGLGCNDVYTESKATFDPGMISVHSQRAAWDYYSGTMSWEDSYKKHINEFRAEYNLPPV